MTVRARILVALALAGFASPLAAQEQGIADSSSVSAPAPVKADSALRELGPTRSAAVVAVQQRKELRAGVNAPMMEKQTFDRGTRYMILGAASLLTGIVVGGTPGRVLEVGGAGVGLYGVYLYVQ